MFRHTLPASSSLTVAKSAQIVEPFPFSAFFLACGSVRQSPQAALARHTLLWTIAAMTKFRSHDDCLCLNILLDRKAAATEHV